MDMNELYKVEDIVYKEIKTVTDNGKFRSREEIDNIYKLMDILKDIKCFEDDGYSEEMDRSYRGYDGRRSYDSESYRGRGRNARRDSMGRYASEGSYRGGRYSSGKQDFVAQLEELMEEAPDEQTKKNIQRMVNDLG